MKAESRFKLHVRGIRGQVADMDVDAEFELLPENAEEPPHSFGPGSL